MDLKEIEHETAYLFQLVRNWAQWQEGSCEYGNEHPG
jgi:hypothetical protein